MNNGVDPFIPTQLTPTYLDVVTHLGDKIMTILLITGVVFVIYTLFTMFVEPNKTQNYLYSKMFMDVLALVLGLHIAVLGLIWMMGWNV